MVYLKIRGKPAPNKLFKVANPVITDEEKNIKMRPSLVRS
jgi:hypothetical protein